MQKIIFSLFVILLLGGFSSHSLQAGPVEEAAERIKERLPQIDAMKAAGSVGETADGFLAPRTSLGPREASLVELENADRRLIYQSLAARTEQSLEEVGRQRAIQIAARARTGVWLQKPNGDWYRK